MAIRKSPAIAASPKPAKAKASQNFINHFLDSLNAFLVICAADGKIMYMNQQFAKITALSRSPRKQYNWYQLFSEKQIAVVAQALSSLSPGNPATVLQRPESDFLSAPANTNWTVEGVFDKNGKLDNFLVLGSPFTSLINQNSKAGISPLLLQEILSDHFELICRYQPDGTLLYVNDNFAQFYHSTPEELTGTSILNTIPNERKGAFVALIKSLSLQKPTYHIAVDYPQPDGRIKWVEWHDYCFFDSAGQLTEIQAVGRNITELHDLQHQVRYSGELFKHTVNIIPDIVIRTTPDLRILFLNKPIPELGILNTETAIGLSLADIIGAERISLLEEISRKLQSSEATLKMTRLTQRGGHTQWMEWMVSGFYDDHKKLMEIQAVGRDVTETRQLHEQLQASQAQYKAIVENQPQLIVRHLPDSTIIFVNKVFSGFTGIPEEKLIGQKWFNLVAPEIAAQLQELMNKLTVEHPTQQFDLELKSYDGSQIWLLWTSTGIFNKEGMLIECQVTGQDITKRKIAEIKLDEAHKRISELETHFRVVADNTPDMQRWVLPDRTLAYISPSCEKITGYSPAEHFKFPELFYQIIHPDDKEMFDKIKDDSFNGKLTPVFETRIISKQGDIRWMEITANHVTGSDGNDLGIRTSSRDITDRKMLQEQLHIREAEYHNIVEGQLDLVCRYKPDGAIIFTNTAYARFFGSTPELLTSTSIFDLIPKHRLLDFNAILHSLTVDEPTNRDEESYRQPDGSLRYIEWVNNAVFDQYGIMLELQGSGHDITHLKEIENELLVSKNRYTSIVENQVEYLCRCNPSGEITFVNSTLASYLGTTSVAMTGTAWKQWMDSQQIKTIMKMMRNKKSSDPVKRLHARISPPGQPELWVEWIGKGIYDQNGNLGEIQLVGRNITEMKHLHDQLLMSERRLKAVVESQSELIERYNSKGDITFVNEALTQFFGISVEDVLGANWSHIEQLVDEKSYNIIKELEVLYDSFQQRELMHTRADGEKRWISWIKTVIHDDDGNTLESQVVGRDITDIKNMSIQLAGALSDLNDYKQQLEVENQYLRTKTEPSQMVEGITTISPVMFQVLEKVKQVAPTDTPVLLFGETGTGKEVLAHAIHHSSKRSHKLMITVNCAALPPSLIESELFGRERGAYAGAIARQIGRFELANGSSIFLDEIGALPLEIQAKLLRVIQTGEYQMLGSPETKKTDVRIIAATNRDLTNAITNGIFRTDLFHRLSVFPINLPPLRERPEDIPLLAWQFVDELAQSMGKSIDRISNESLKILMDYSWPGNVRELRNLLEYSIIHCNSRTLEVQLHGNEFVRSNDDSIDHELRRHIEKVLIQTNWRVRGEDGAAARLGIKESTLRFRMKKLGIKRR